METYLGPYILGGLEPDEEANLCRHLDDCAECRDALDEIAWIPAWLRKVPADELELLIAEDNAQEPASMSSGHDGALATIAVERARRRRRNRWLAAAVVVIAVVAVGVTVELAHDSGTVPAASTVHSVDQHTRVAASLAIASQGARTGLRLNLAGVAPGEHCSLIARAQDGRTDVAATWVATYRGTADIPATTTIPAARLKEFDVVTADGRVLVRLAVLPHR